MNGVASSIVLLLFARTPILPSIQSINYCPLLVAMNLEGSFEQELFEYGLISGGLETRQDQHLFVLFAEAQLIHDGLSFFTIVEDTLRGLDAGFV